MDISYTPEKIDEFVRKAEQSLQKSVMLYKQYRNNILSISMQDVVDSPMEFRNLLDKIRSSKNSTQNIYDVLFRVTDKYDIFNAPSNVKRLEVVATELDHVTSDIGQLEDALENIIEASEDLNKQYYIKS